MRGFLLAQYSKSLVLLPVSGLHDELFRGNTEVGGNSRNDGTICHVAFGGFADIDAQDVRLRLLDVGFFRIRERLYPDGGHGSNVPCG